MNKIKTVKSNFIWNLILNISTVALPLISFPYVARILGPEGTGRVAFVQSTLSYFIMFATLGMPSYALRECSKLRYKKDDLNKFVQEMLGITIISTTIVYLILILTIFMIPKFAEEKMLFFTMGCSVFLGAFNMEWLYQALEEYRYIAIRSILVKIASVILIFVLIKNSSNVLQYGFITIVSSSGAYLFNLLRLKKFIKLKFIKNFSLKRHIKAIFILFGASAAISIYTQTDIVMLGFMKGNAETGLYSATVRIKNVILNIITSLNMVLIPRMTYFVSINDKIQFTNYLKKSLNFLLFLSLPMIEYCIILAKPLLFLFSGHKYINAIPILRIQMICIIFLALNNLIGCQILVPKGKDNIYCKSVACGCVANIILNALMIPVLRGMGAALASLLAEGVVFSVMFREEHLSLKLAFSSGLGIIKYIQANFLATLILLLCYKLLLTQHYFIQILIGSICFWGIYVVFLYFKKEIIVQEILKSLKKIIGREYDKQ